MRMRYFLATTLTAFFSFAWSDAEAATATGTFNVQVTIAPSRKISRAFGVLLLPAWFARKRRLGRVPASRPRSFGGRSARRGGDSHAAQQWGQADRGPGPGFPLDSGGRGERLEPTDDVVASPPGRSSCNRRRTMLPASCASRKNRLRARRPTVSSSTSCPSRHRAGAPSI